MLSLTEFVSILAFADDIVIIANNEKKLQQILKCVETWCKNWKLKVNTEKTTLYILEENKNNEQYLNLNLKIIHLILETDTNT